jgi:heat shock protein HtpX
LAIGRNAPLFDAARRDHTPRVFKRVTLYVLTNLAVLFVLGITMTVLSATGILGDDPSQLVMLFAFSAVFGFGGSIISLFMSKSLAKMATGAQVIPHPRNPDEQWLFDTVKRQAAASGIGMPEIALYDSPDMNAFATGASRNSALVAVSTGLLSKMNHDQIEAVLAHEITHVANGDMVTLTLIQGTLNTFVLFLSRVIGFAVDSWLSRGERRYGPGIGYWLTVMVMQIVLGIGATIIVMWFSRQREFRADEGGARLAGAAKMAAALERLKTVGDAPALLPESVQTMGIRAGREGGFRALFHSHPPLEVRIARLRHMEMRGR